MIQKDSLGKDLPQHSGRSACFWNFHTYSGSQDTYSESRHSYCDCRHSHDTCHGHTCSSLDPTSRFWVGPIFRFSQKNNMYCRRSGVSRATYTTRYSSNWLECCQCSQRPLFLAKEGIQNEGFHQNQSSSIIIRENPSSIQKKTSPNFSFLQPK